MTWLKKDDRFPDHRKIRRLTDSAYRLHDTALCYAAKDESDGFLDEADIDEMQHGKRLRKNIPALIEERRRLARENGVDPEFVAKIYQILVDHSFDMQVETLKARSK